MLGVVNNLFNDLSVFEPIMERGESSLEVTLSFPVKIKAAKLS